MKRLKAVNGIPLQDFQGGFAYDGCHKIYLIATKADLEQMYEAGYEESDILPLDMLEEIYNASCPFRFIQKASDFADVVPQCTDPSTVQWEYEDVDGPVTTDAEASLKDGDGYSLLLDGKLAVECRKTAEGYVIDMWGRGKLLFTTCVWDEDLEQA